MTGSMLLISFFLFTLAAVSAAGYVFVMRPARAQADEQAAPAPVTLGQLDLPIEMLIPSP